MSASEKLKALVAAERADHDHADDSAQNEILNALPQIVAVVEAAEMVSTKMRGYDKLIAALTALEEALS